MELSCNLETVQCNNEADVERFIQKCAINQSEDIWISHNEEYPCLALLVTRELACVHYFGSDTDHYQSTGDLTDDGTTLFPGPEGVEEMPNYTVVPLSAAIECAKQFLHFKNRPNCISWNEI